MSGDLRFYYSVNDAFCEKHFDRKALRSFEWDERDPDDEVSPESLIEKDMKEAVGVFVGGARAGEQIHILMKTDAGVSQDDEELQARVEARREESEARQRRIEAIEQRINNLLPEDVLELRAKAPVDDYEFVSTLFNWACLVGGIGCIRYEDEYADSFDVSDTAVNSSAGLKFIWACTREEISELMARHCCSGGELEKNEWFALSTLCEWLGVSLEELGKVDAEGGGDAQV